MTSQQFAFWLQGFFEISNKDPKYTGALNRDQVNMIEKHLSLVFIHEIDPSHGPKEHTDKLDKLHNSPAKHMFNDPYAQHDEIDDHMYKQTPRPRC
jgi:hypothetical protein